MNTDDLIKKSQDEDKLSQSELTHLLSLPPDSADLYRVMAEANRISKEVSGGISSSPHPINKVLIINWTQISHFLLSPRHMAHPE